MTFATGLLVLPLGYRKERSGLAWIYVFFAWKYKLLRYILCGGQEKRGIWRDTESRLLERTANKKKRATPSSNTRVQYPPYPPYPLSVWVQILMWLGDKIAKNEYIRKCFLFLLLIGRYKINTTILWRKRVLFSSFLLLTESIWGKAYTF